MGVMPSAPVSAWIEAARPKTLPASLAPVLLGAAHAWAIVGHLNVARTLLALFVALALQVGVNYANDYSDGIRGTDDVGKRVGPQRLTGPGLAAPGAVLAAALASFALAALAGLALIAVSRAWYFLLIGVLAIVAAWYYTGGKHPYGYIGGVADLLVFCFFGLVATMGTIYTQVDHANVAAWSSAAGIGLLSCALLMVNNLRDLPGDRDSGKKTLAVRLGDNRARWVYYAYVCFGCLLAIPTSVVAAAILALAGFIIARPVGRGASGLELIRVLKHTGLLTLAYGVVVGAAAIIG